MDNYDVIIIGSGLGGLTAAATLAKEGKSVLVLEQYARLGGFGQSYSKQGYTFDIAIHAIWFWDEISTILKEFGEELEVVPARTCDRIIYRDGHEFNAVSIPEMQEQISRIVPNEADGVAKYYNELIDAQRVLVELLHNPDNWSLKIDFVKHSKLWKSSLEQAVKNCVSSEKARDLLFGYHDSYLYDYSWNYPAYHLYCTKYLYDGFLPVGGSQPLVDALVRSVRRMGGELRVNTLVKRILVDKNKAYGVILGNGEKILAKDAVVSNADALLTYEKMVGYEHLPPSIVHMINKWRNYVPSLSYYIMNCGVDIDVKETYNMEGDLTIYYPENNILDGFKKINNGILDDDFWLWMVFPTNNDKTLAPKGHSVAIFSILVPYNIAGYSQASKDYEFDGFSPQSSKGAGYEAFKQELMEKILARADEVYPGISSHITYKDFITPQTIERITLNHKGSTLGFKVIPELEKTAMKGFNLNIGCPIKSPIDGLYMASGWSETGFSAPGVIAAGREAAFDILGKRGKSITIDHTHRTERLINQGIHV
jgi:phytoene dehydrogenase-like protein